MRFLLVSGLSFALLFSDLQALTPILEEQQYFQPSSSESTDFKPAWSKETCLDFASPNLECLEQLPAEGEHLRPSIGEVLDLKLNSDDFKGEMLL